MKNKRKMLTAGILAAAVTGSGVFALSASAQKSTSDDSLAGKIAATFNLNKDEVQSVLNEHRSEQRTERQKEHRAMLEQRLDQAITEGKLTQDQKTKILAYLDSQSVNFQNIEDKTDEERQAAMKAQREEMKKWAADNNIDLTYVLPGRGMGPHGHMDMDMKGGTDAYSI